MAKTVVCWYRHGHENRNDLLRYGLMQLHVQGLIKYIERDITKATEAGYSSTVADSQHRHVSFLTVLKQSHLKKILVDSEDSFIHLSGFITEADVYFAAGYNTDIHIHKKIPAGYVWQTDADLDWYREKISTIINALGNQFNKIKPFIPIGPNLAFNGKSSALVVKRNNIIYRLNKFFTGNIYWHSNYSSFNKRYDELLALRSSKLKYDVILNDTLWGWPLHRIRLHKKLAALAGKFRIQAVLNWHSPYHEDGSDKLELNPNAFPIKTGGDITDYEKMLSESKMGVFASGFHWGWRNIMTLGLLVGVPVLIDELLLEPYFNMREFDMHFNSDTDWNTIEGLLNNISPEKWETTKLHNQSVYDRYLAPSAVANYFLNTVG
ncbi:MAG: hypothetical protein JKY70_01285 [Mucilaginibacter sp.]|nr:hypothetical protein [Mucilaginibacter sp.]